MANFITTFISKDKEFDFNKPEIFFAHSMFERNGDENYPTITFKDIIQLYFKDELGECEENGCTKEDIKNKLKEIIDLIYNDLRWGDE